VVEVGEEGLDEGGDGGFVGFGGGGVAEVAEGLAGDGADGGEGDAGGEGQVGGFEEVEEVAGGGGGGEGDDVGVGFGRGEEGLEGEDGAGGDSVAVGFDEGEVGSGGGEGFGEGIARFGGSEEEHVGGLVVRGAGVGDEGFGERFGDVLRGDEVDGEADSLHGLCGGGADDGDSLGDEGSIAALVKDFDGVGAGEEEPVEGFELGESGVERGVGCGGDDLDGGDEEGCGSEGFELGGEAGGLVAGSGDEDAFFGERHSRHFRCFGEGGGKDMACRPGPLRAGRSLRDLYTLRLALPLVAMEILVPTGRATRYMPRSGSGEVLFGGDLPLTVETGKLETRVDELL
jgi:hypothetical protein